MFFIWIGLIISLSLIELLKRNLVTIWFALSAIISLIFSFFTKSYIIQFCVFAIIGSLLFYYFRNNAVKKVKEKREKLLLGKIATVIEDITKKKLGKIKIGYKKYSARSNKKIKKYKMVKIIAISGNILNVEEVRK